MRTTLFVLALFASSVRAEDPKITEAEKEIGVRSVEQIGPWKVRTGILTDQGRASFGVKTFPVRFAYATQTLAGDWTLGVRLLVLEQKSTNAIGVEKVVKDVPVYYLQGPKDLGEVEVKQYRNGTWWDIKVKALGDGTLGLGDLSTEEPTFRVGKEVLKFDASKLDAAKKAVLKCREESEVKDAAPKLKPPPR